MNKSRRTVLNIIFLVAVLFLTFFSVLRGESIPDLLRNMARADWRYLVAAVACVLAFLCGQGVVIFLMLRAVGMKRSFWKCMLISCTGYFFCCITPFQSGGPPVQVISLRKEGIPVPVGSIVILVMTFLFKLVLVVVGILYLLFGWRFLNRYLRGVLPLFGVGLFLTIGFSFLLAFFIFHPTLMHKVILVVYDWFVKKSWFRRLIKDTDAMRRRLVGFLERYKETAAFFKTHLRLMIVLFFVTVGQRFCYFLTTWFVYRAFGLSGASLLLIVTLQSVISISADLLPLPGGAGVSEGMFMRIFRPIFGALTLPGMMLSRGITYYVQLLFCGIMTIAGRAVIGRRTPSQRL